MVQLAIHYVGGRLPELLLLTWEDENELDGVREPSGGEGGSGRPGNIQWQCSIIVSVNRRCIAVSVTMLL